MTTLDLEQRAFAIPEQAQALTITDTTTFEQATELLLAIKDLRNEVDSTFSPMTAKAHAAWKETLTQRKHHEEPLLKAEGILKPRIAAYLFAHEQARQAEEAKAQEAAQLQEAVEAEARGDQAGAEAALNGQGVVSVNLPPSVPKVAGISQRESWKAEVVDFPSLIKAVASGQVPQEVLLPNLPALNQAARALKTGLRYPGVRVMRELGIAAGRR